MRKIMFSRLARSVLLLGFAALVLLAAQRAAWAYGAVAVSKADGRYVIGTVVKARTRASAEQGALSYCTGASDNQALKSNCKIVATFQGYCVAIARDSSGSKDATALGWDASQRESEAAENALASCNKRVSGGQSCKVTTRLCDTQVPNPWIDKKDDPLEELDFDPVIAMVLGGLALVGFIGFTVWWLAGGRGQRNSSVVSEYVPPSSRRRAAPPPAPPTFQPGPTVQPGVTVLPGATVQPGVTVQPGMTIQPGVTVRPGGYTVAPTEIGDAEQLQNLPTRVLKSLDGGSSYRLDPARLAQGGITLGRREDCDITLKDSKVSGRHARFVFDESGTIMIEDLDSSNGTWVNGERKTRTALNAGDRVSFGNLKFAVE